MTEDDFLKKVKNGSWFSVNFKKRTISLRGRDIQLESTQRLSPTEFETQLLDLYLSYKYSVPSETSKKESGYFPALSYEELSMEDLVYGEERVLARAKLELFILQQIKAGFTWEDVMTLNKKVGWFYQNQHEKELILRREWFKGA